MTKKTTIVLFTRCYPYDIKFEYCFLNPEIRHLALNFDRIILVPSDLRGKRLDIPPNVEVEGSFAIYIQDKSILNKILYLFLTLISSLFYREFINNLIVLLNKSALRRLIVFIHTALRTQRWVSEYIENNGLDLKNTIFYTYWLEHISMGIGLAQKTYPEIKLVSRAHGIDFHEERFNPPYIPCRTETLRKLDKLFFVSANGKKYMTDRYPSFEHKYEIFKLGVKNPGFLTDYSKDTTYQIVSCSFIVPVKRIDLLLKGITELGKLRPLQKFEWWHIGGGPQMPYVEEMASKIMPGNVRYHFLGNLPNDKVILFYKNNPVDLFVHVSSSEGGIPVSIMEAQSCGIPVVATAVGGSKEIVSDEVGKLLKENPTPEQIAREISSMLDSPKLAIEKRKTSRLNWQDHYDADKNFAEFASRLKCIIESH